MSDTIHCPQCGGHSPKDARFCIDCGATITPAVSRVSAPVAAPASTGPTVQLRGKACPHCATLGPDDARFCVACGRPMSVATPQNNRSRPSPARPMQRQSYARTATIPAPPRYAPRRAPRRPISGTAVLVIGTLVLLATNSFWPGILLVVGLSMLVGNLNAGRTQEGLQALLWLGGLAWLFTSGMFWPGILLLFLINWALSQVSRPSRGGSCW